MTQLFSGEAQDMHEHDAASDPEHAGPVSAMVAAAVPLALGVVFILLSLRLPLGRPGAPGPGLWPLVCAIAVVVSSGVLLVVSRRVEHPEKVTRGVWAVGVGLLTLIALTFAMPLVGFEVPLALLFAVWLKVLGGEGWRTTVVGSVVATLAVYGLFIVALGLPIPHLF